jgi:hypothetical protein
MTAVILFLASKKYSEFGYSFHPGVAALVFIAAGSAVTAASLIGKKPAAVLMAALFSWAAVHVFSILSFPLHPGRSDMLPLIAAACREFLSGGFPYKVYALTHELALTYLPGLWGSFLPAAWLGVDPRFMNLLFLPLAVLIAKRSAPSLKAGPCSGSLDKLQQR